MQTLPKEAASSPKMPYCGQWIGGFEGNPPGFVTFNVERDRASAPFVCIVQGAQMPGSRIDFNWEVNGNHFTARSTNTRVFDLQDQSFISAEESMKRAEGRIYYSKEIRIDDGVIDELGMKGTWVGDRGQSGGFTLHNPMRRERPPADHKMNWDQFRAFVAGLIRDGKERIFRGQSSSQWPLRTSGTAVRCGALFC